MKKIIFILGVFLSLNTKAQEVTVVAQTNPNDASTKCGDNCTWTLYSNGKLEILGTGDMIDFHHAEQPWYTNLDLITSIEIENGITSIGEKAFHRAENLTSVEIPDSVTKIKYDSFYGAKNLTNIVIPDRVELIGQDAFGGTKLSKVVVPDSVTRIDNWAFPSTVTNLFIGEQVTSISDLAFRRVSGQVYCAMPSDETESPCAGKASNIGYYTKDKSGAYKIGDDYYATASDLINEMKCLGGLTEDCIAKALNEKSSKLYNQGKVCKSMESCQALVYSDYNNEILSVGNKNYASLADLLSGKYIPKRIYTIDEANKVAKPSGNTVRIKYR